MSVRRPPARRSWTCWEAFPSGGQARLRRGPSWYASSPQVEQDSLLARITFLTGARCPLFDAAHADGRLTGRHTQTVRLTPLLCVIHCQHPNPSPRRYTNWTTSERLGSVRTLYIKFDQDCAVTLSWQPSMYTSVSFYKRRSRLCASAALTY